MKASKKILLMTFFSALIVGTALAHNGPETLTTARESGPVIQQPHNSSAITVIPTDDPRSNPDMSLINELREMNKSTKEAKEPQNA